MVFAGIRIGFATTLRENVTRVSLYLSVASATFLRICTLFATGSFCFFEQDAETKSRIDRKLSGRILQESGGSSISDTGSMISVWIGKPLLRRFPPTRSSFPVSFIEISSSGIRFRYAMNFFASTAAVIPVSNGVTTAISSLKDTMRSFRKTNESDCSTVSLPATPGRIRSSERNSFLRSYFISHTPA